MERCSRTFDDECLHVGPLFTGRGGKGRELLQRGQFTRVIPGDVENPQPLTP